ncbi:molybdenum ABC transporter ATP-binding protein [Stutzerimonas kirkiae]|uniref:Molybdenum ABC transporter ATP-binding protein n=1 Tax=Stutzerimonas kirkiae TaxID=2211392 RepID=A0A4Q9R8R3_9GAMM|nr:molybdenum ABC transporter ATP-binding protein [Stutzerimonas kirkiae]TBU96891.1 molybdenum ABC transporter ATP-binding protein [Stutzerimonas kirkiae]TBV00511.1 molybdenum ABC transporter ATP-binding protein [Stutzerimonas kirkiae]TBV04032.1 molybdenum ABC transporter ATP-binding protein [Stutzerimonas kirkiae]TBV16754.1 molybdenum ABC transporter ATP-binding protein [Stutzerimonas kirkiae]
MSSTHNPEKSIHARLRLDYPGFELDVELNLPGHGVTALFGHSGSGKTTCLRCIAGLERAQQARVEINGELWQDSASALFVPVHRRALGYVFQEPSLFPHLSVRRNLQYGMRRVDAGLRKVPWDRVMQLLGIGHLLERMPQRLSGGERQRVGIARALLTSPRLLLMDEPLAALDLKRKNEILPYLERLHDDLEIPILYVSHSPDEVARLADHLVLLEDGRAIAQGGLQQTLARLDLPIAFGEDAGVLIQSTVSEHDDRYQLTRLVFRGGNVLVARRPEAIGQPLRFRVSARDVSLSIAPIEGSSITNALAVSVREVVATDTPAHVLVGLDADGTPLLARITRRSADQLGATPGRRLWAQIKSVALLG